MLLIQTWTPGLDWEIQARGQRSRAATEAVGLVTLLAGTSAELVLPRARLHFCSLSRRVFHIRAGKTPSSPLCPLSVFEFLWSLSSSVRPASLCPAETHSCRVTPVTPTGPSERKAASPERLEALFMFGRDSEAPRGDSGRVSVPQKAG